MFNPCGSDDVNVGIYGIVVGQKVRRIGDQMGNVAELGRRQRSVNRAIRLEVSNELRF